MRTPNPRTIIDHTHRIRIAVLGALLGWALPPLQAQVSPNEIINPQLKSLEKTYLKKLVEFNRAVAGIKFPYPLMLSRFAGLEPKKQLTSDRRGLEFVYFHGRTVLKLTGNYNAAFNSDRLTPNQRSSRVFNEVVLPVLRLLPGYFTPKEDFDAFGFEISFHTQTESKEYQYEGKEILVVVFDRLDCFQFLGSQSDSGRQEVLNRSEIYLNGKEFGMALGQPDPFDLKALERSRHNQSPPSSAYASKLPFNEPVLKPPADQTVPQPQGTETARIPPQTALPPQNNPAAMEPLVASNRLTANWAEMDLVQAKYQVQLDELNKEGVAHHQFLQYVPPSFGIFQNRIYLQLSLRNPTKYEKDSTSIYKRAAQSFDLFLAPQLKPILAKVPNGSDFDGLEITIVNELTSKATSSSEAIEFICPLKILRQFANAEITNQELINQSIVLVNEVRIALDLQKAE